MQSGALKQSWSPGTTFPEQLMQPGRRGDARIAHTCKLEDQNQTRLSGVYSNDTNIRECSEVQTVERLVVCRLRGEVCAKQQRKEPLLVCDSGKTSSYNKGTRRKRRSYLKSVV